MTGILLTALAFFRPSTTCADAFDTLCCGVNCNRLFFDKQFTRFWLSEYGGTIFLASPFYAGTVQAGIDYQYCRNLSNAQTDFDFFTGYVQWGEKFYTLKSFHIILSGRIGLVRMVFDQENETTALKNEHEITTAVLLSVSSKVAHSWKIQCSAGYHTLYTHHKIHHYSLSCGFARSFSSPRWIKEFLE